MSTTEATPQSSWRLAIPRGRQLVLDTHPRVMGVLNITPDSFSDGGRFSSPPAAIEHGLRLLDQGADLLDLGAESTRPGGGVYGQGARSVGHDEEIDRLLPVLEALRARTDAVLSVDTRHGATARAALAAGADLINDVGGLADEALAEAVAEAGCPVVLMHSRGHLATMQRGIAFDDVVAEVRGELAMGVERARAAGIDPAQVVLDPGIGFGKTAHQNFVLLQNTARLRELGHPILIGASRKSFLATAHDAPPDRRLGGSLAAALWSARAGAQIVRVHDVFETVQALRVWRAIDRAGSALQ